ncbi:MAG: serine hydrolase [Spirochaetes bacterium]|nr:serine hydrolase [Spirochaetota bacterium]
MDTNDTMTAIVDKHEREERFSGAVLVRRDGAELACIARGFAHRGFAVTNRPDTRFDTASITKVFTAIAAFRLVDRGLLRLDERVLDIVDIGVTRISRDVTIGQLLTHTSGIADDADEEAGEDYEDIWKATPCYNARSTRDFLPNFAMKEPVFSPGTSCRYNNCAFVLAGLALEERSGMSYRELVAREVFAPAGMTRTGFFAKDGTEPDVAEGYATVEDADGNPAGVRKNIYAYPPVGSPDAGALTTVGDLWRLFFALEGPGLLSVASGEAMLGPVANYMALGNGDERRMGYALEFDYRPDGSLLRFGKDGVNPGVAAIAMRYPARDGFVAILANQDADVWTLCRELAAAAGLGPAVAPHG